MRLIVAASLALLLAGCNDIGNVGNIPGIVEEVRITSSITHQGEGSGSAVGGAIVGGALAGPVGAVVGAEVGRPSGITLSTVHEVQACSLIVITDNQRVVFSSTYKPRVLECSLLRESDKINIQKTTSKDGDLKYYRWYTSSTAYITGEILPR